MKQRSSNRSNSSVDKLGLSVLNRYRQEFCCQSLVWWACTCDPSIQGTEAGGEFKSIYRESLSSLGYRMLFQMTKIADSSWGPASPAVLQFFIMLYGQWLQNCRVGGRSWEAGEGGTTCFSSHSWEGDLFLTLILL